MQSTLALMAALVSLTGPEVARAAPAPQVTVEATVLALDDVEVAAQEAGVLVQLEAKPGLEVEAESLLGNIDDARTQAQRQEALFDYEAARLVAEDDVEVRFAAANTAVSEQEYRMSLEANKKKANSITLAELRRQALMVEKGKLQAEKAEHDRKIAGYTAQSKQARLQQLDEALRARQIKAPIGGLVVDVMKDRGEWVNPGDPVLRMVRMDRLRVDGFLNIGDFSPSEVSGRPVTVRVKLERGRVAEFPGKITFVHREVQATGEYRVRAEVINRRENNHWMLGPGLQGEMTIDVGGNLAEAAPAPTQHAQR